MPKSFPDLEYANKKKLTWRDRFLAEIEMITPWEQLQQAIESFYPKAFGAGCPPIGLARMLRMYMAQQCFGLSDEGIEDVIYDNQAILAFVGIDLIGSPRRTQRRSLNFAICSKPRGSTRRSSTRSMAILPRRV